MSSRAKIIAIVIAWIVALVCAGLLDSTVAEIVHGSRIEQFLLSHRVIREIWRGPGSFAVTFPVIALIFFLHASSWRGTLFVLIGALFTGINGLTKWMAGRTRPYKLHPGIAEPFVLDPFRGGLPGMFKQTNLCFPSGDVALAFATAAALSILLPRWRWCFYPIAAIVAAERVLENAHWLSDTVAAAALGIGGVQLVRWIWCNVGSTESLPFACDSRLQRAGEHSHAATADRGSAVADRQTV